MQINIYKGKKRLKLLSYFVSGVYSEKNCLVVNLNINQCCLEILYNTVTRVNMVVVDVMWHILGWNIKNKKYKKK
jgi:hypothetical protein